MLSMALELAEDESGLRRHGLEFFEHFIHIADAMNSIGGTGLWDDKTASTTTSYNADGAEIPLRTRSLVGLLPLIAVEVIETERSRSCRVSRSGWIGF